MLKLKTKAQSLSEYALLIVLVMAVVLGMQTYMKRGIQAVIKLSAEQLAQQPEAEEIDPFKGTKKGSNLNTITSGTARQTVSLDGSHNSTIKTTSTTTGTSTFIFKRGK